MGLEGRIPSVPRVDNEEITENTELEGRERSLGPDSGLTSLAPRPLVWEGPQLSTPSLDVCECVNLCERQRRERNWPLDTPDRNTNI